MWDGVVPELASDSIGRCAAPSTPTWRVDRPRRWSSSSGCRARRYALPTGVVTFVLTDIEGSTPLWEAHPAAMAEVIARHHETAADIVEAHGGRMPVAGRGRQHALRFARASELPRPRRLPRAVAAEQFPEGIRLRYVPACTPARRSRTRATTRRGGEPGGPPPRAGAGGQVYISQATAALIVEHLPTDATLHDVGRFALRGHGP